MPKKNPKPDPLAKVSAPNLRRMVKRLQADEKKLTRVCQSHHERYLQTLARVMELEADRDRLAAELAAMKRQPLDAVDVTMAGDEGRRFVPRLPQVSVPLPDDANDNPHPCGTLEGVQYVLTRLHSALSEPTPDDARQQVVVGQEDVPAKGWRTDVRCGGDAGEQGLDVCLAHPDEPTTLPAMPGATLAVPTFTTAWLIPFWRRYDRTLYAPAVSDSNEGRAALLGEEAVVVWPSTFGTTTVPWFAWSLGDIHPPPATWRQA